VTRIRLKQKQKDSYEHISADMFHPRKKESTPSFKLLGFRLKLGQSQNSFAGCLQNFTFSKKKIFLRCKGCNFFGRLMDLLAGSQLLAELETPPPRLGWGPP